MRRQFATFQTFTSLINYLLSREGEHLVVICAPKSALIDDDDTTNPLHLQPQVPTLNRLAVSRRIQLLFAPTLAHLRVLLCNGFSHRVTEASDPASRPVVIVNCLTVHRDVGSQGLAQTLAIAVEAVAAAGVNLLLVECGDASSSTERHDIDVAHEPSRSTTGWQTQIPILGVRSSGPAHRPWAGRTVPAQRVVAQWCEPLRAVEPSLDFFI